MVKVGTLGIEVGVSWNERLYKRRRFWKKTALSQSWIGIKVKRHFSMGVLNLGQLSIVLSNLSNWCLLLRRILNISIVSRSFYCDVKG